MVDQAMNVHVLREKLCEMLTCDDPAAVLWLAVENGLMHRIVPEFASLKMRQDPEYRHKDVLAHTIAVVAMTPNNLVVFSRHR